MKGKVPKDAELGDKDPKEAKQPKGKKVKKAKLQKGQTLTDLMGTWTSRTSGMEIVPYTGNGKVELP